MILQSALSIFLGSLTSKTTLVKGQSDSPPHLLPVLHSDRRRIQTECSTAGHVYNTCSKCCGYKFPDRSALKSATDLYLSDNPAAIATYGVINCWDVSSVTDMNTLFKSTRFNETISCWDVSRVTNMDHMFNYADYFNQPLDS